MRVKGKGVFRTNPGEFSVLKSYLYRGKLGHFTVGSKHLIHRAIIAVMFKILPSPREMRFSIINSLLCRTCPRVLLLRRQTFQHPAKPLLLRRPALK